LKKADKIAIAAKKAEEYLNRFPKWTDKQKQLNKKTYDNAIELSAWLSVYKFGNEDVSKQAGMIIYAICGKWK
jgi:hypothetical protein